MNVNKNLVEITMLLVIAAGFIFAITSRSVLATYSLAVLLGIVFGKIWYKFRRKPRIPFLIIVAGFAVGYGIGTIYGSRIFSVMLFVLAMIASYMIHERAIIRDYSH